MTRYQTQDSEESWAGAESAEQEREGNLTHLGQLKKDSAGTPLPQPD